ncbi:MAG: cupin domain-containing protein [Methanosarcinales archaeon]|nr:cupin domain-containing protein [Methanosarcinales archaeon]
MLEIKYDFKSSDVKLVERIVNDDNVHINHIILGKGDNMPEHFSNSNLYLIIVQGEMKLTLGEQEAHDYPHGSIINFPYNTKMFVQNEHSPLLEFFVVKSPNPKDFKE